MNELVELVRYGTGEAWASDKAGAMTEAWETVIRAVADRPVLRREIIRRLRVLTEELVFSAGCKLRLKKHKLWIEKPADFLYQLTSLFHHYRRTSRTARRFLAQVEAFRPQARGRVEKTVQKLVFHHVLARQV